jgi:L-alanine-DL-glutamate epimerase-like enolase superfamily enzyme
MAASPNCFRLGMNVTPDPFKEGVLQDGPVAKNGHFDIPDKPGLGVELREGLEDLYPPLPGDCFIPEAQIPR